MEAQKKLGIWIDHSNAHITEFTNDHIETQIIESQFTHEDKMHSLARSENQMHNRQQHEKAEYYKKLSEVIKNFEEVILFGPTDAKSELFNLLRADHRFSKIKIEMIQTDKMTENQEYAFVKEYFKTH